MGLFHFKINVPGLFSSAKEVGNPLEAADGTGGTASKREMLRRFASASVVIYSFSKIIIRPFCAYHPAPAHLYSFL